MLKDANRSPGDVVIHEESVVLKVLAFGNAVRADEKVNHALARHFLRPLLGAGRKGAQDRTHIRAQAGQAGFVRAGAADHGEVDAKRRMRPARKLAVQIVRRVGEGREEQQLEVIAVDRRINLVCYQRSEEHTYELQSLMRISYTVFCLTKQNT